jgi:hypothetical protein
VSSGSGSAEVQDRLFWCRGGPLGIYTGLGALASKSKIFIPYRIWHSGRRTHYVAMLRTWHYLIK